MSYEAMLYDAPEIVSETLRAVYKELAHNKVVAIALSGITALIAMGSEWFLEFTSQLWIILVFSLPALVLYLIDLAIVLTPKEAKGRRAELWWRTTMSSGVIAVLAIGMLLVFSGLSAAANLIVNDFLAMVFQMFGLFIVFGLYVPRLVRRWKLYTKADQELSLAARLVIRFWPSLGKNLDDETIREVLSLRAEQEQDASTSEEESP